MSRKAYRMVQKTDVVVGYRTYVDLLEEVISSDQEIFSTGMKGEVERAEKAIEFSGNGKDVAVVSSGDPGVYGMAGLIVELVEKRGLGIEPKIVPGITSASAAAASLGAPLTNDFAAVSLSDLLTPWKKIKERLAGAAEGDFVTALYNPRSKKRKEQIEIARKIFLRHRNPKTPVGIVRSAKRGKEEKTIVVLDTMLEPEIDMLTTVIIGNSRTYVAGDTMVTPRGYEL
ncbi:MAG: precorrin-3B C(17)-methyltransferase [Candidatus Bipolaricaulota bacterium]